MYILFKDIPDEGRAITGQLDRDMENEAARRSQQTSSEDEKMGSVTQMKDRTPKVKSSTKPLMVDSAVGTDSELSDLAESDSDGPGSVPSRTQLNPRIESRLYEMGRYRGKSRRSR
ncbi:hypothetical protein T439DRAFT_325786 [Meredithblackwellia eburnea MCA 4105]